LGNGTITGRYRRIGITGFVHVTLVAGTTTTYGTGHYTVTLPSGWTGRTLTNGIQTGTMINVRGGSTYPGQVWCYSAGTVLYLVDASAPMVLATNTVPGTWAAGDYFTLNITLELAP
jgi:hypothetical protein